MLRDFLRALLVNGLIGEKGMIFSMDLMLALILVTVMIGVSADSMDLVGSKMQDCTYAKSMERVTTSAADMLINTPGSPENWESLSDLKGITPGLASIDPTNGKPKPNVLSIDKINRLKEVYDILIPGKVIPTYCNSSLGIYPINQSSVPIIIKNNTTNIKSTDVFVVNRSVLCSYLNSSILVFIKPDSDVSNNSEPNKMTEYCPHHDVSEKSERHQPVDYKNKKSGWNCYRFQITRDMLENMDFYIMTDPAVIKDSEAGWIVDRPGNSSNKTEKFNNLPILVNDKIKECSNNESTSILWLHVFSSGNEEIKFNTYLAGFPKGTPPEKVSVLYLNPQPCYFILKVWT